MSETETNLIEIPDAVYRLAETIKFIESSTKKEVREIVLGHSGDIEKVIFIV